MVPIFLSAVELRGLVRARDMLTDLADPDAETVLALPEVNEALEAVHSVLRRGAISGETGSD